MKNLKSQITIFVLLGLIISIGFGFVIYLNNGTIKQTEIEKSNKIIFQTNPIKLFIENCIEDTGKSALIYIGKHGGYFETKKPYLKDANFDLPYYLYNNLDFSPSIHDIEYELSKYMDNNIQSCINNFEYFKKQGFGITYENPRASAFIGEDFVSFDLFFPIQIKKENTKQKIENFNVNLNEIHLKNIYNTSKEIVNFQYKNPDKLCLTCIYELSEKADLFIDVQSYRNNSIIFVIKDYNITSDSIINKPYNFTFSIKYVGISCDRLNEIEDPDLIQECIELKTYKTK